MRKPNEALTLSRGIAECRRRGWAVVHVPGEGLRPCRPDEPGAYVDLSRLAYRRETWDRGLDDRQPDSPGR